MLKFIMMGFIAALSIGCASSSAPKFTVVPADAEGQQSTVQAETIETSANAQEPRSLSPTKVSDHAGGGAATPHTTGSLQGFATELATASMPGNGAYKIGPQDVIDISVFKVPELSKTVQVSEAGTVNLPLLGEVEAVNKTARDLEKDLAGLLGDKYLRNPQVSVFIKEYNSQRITVDGAVKRPGIFPLQGGMSLLQAVALAQGLEDLSDDTVLIFRKNNGQRQAARFDISEIRTGDARDPQLLAGDVIIAGTSDLKKGFGTFLKVLPITGLFTLL